MGFFKGFRNIRVNIAQIIVVVIFLPFVAVLCSALTPNNAGGSMGGILLSLVGEIPLLNIVCGILSQYVSGFTASNVLEITAWVLIKAFPDAALVGICVHVFEEMFNHGWNAMRLGMKKREAELFKPLPIFPAFLGIFAATIIVNLFDLFGNVMVALIGEIIVIVVMIIAIRLMFGKLGRGKIFSAKKIMLIMIDSIYAIIVSAYLAAHVLVGLGYVTNMSQRLSLIGTTLGTMLAASLLVTWVHRGARKDSIV